MNKEQLKELQEVSEQTEKFLTEYANNVYGKCEYYIEIGEDNITQEMVKEFIQKANLEDMLEVLSYTKYKQEMIDDQSGAGDLEDWIKCVIKKDDI